MIFGRQVCLCFKDRALGCQDGGDLEVEVCGDPLRHLALLSHFKELKGEGDYSCKYAQCLVSVLLASGMLPSLMKSWGKIWGAIPH